MTSEPEYAPDLEVPEDAPEADVLEQYLTPSGPDEEDVADEELPDEADPADVDDQRRSIGDADEDDYR